MFRCHAWENSILDDNPHVRDELRQLRNFTWSFWCEHDNIEFSWIGLRFLQLTSVESSLCLDWNNPLLVSWHAWSSFTSVADHWKWYKMNKYYFKSFPLSVSSIAPCFNLALTDSAPFFPFHHLRSTCCWLLSKTDERKLEPVLTGEI